VKAVEIQEFGIDNLAFVDRPDPKPGPGQALVRMHAFSLNFRDLMVARGEYNPRLKRPMVPLSDGAGEVVATGPGVTRVAAGDRVMPIFMQRWIAGEPDEAGMRSALGGGVDGVAAESIRKGWSPSPVTSPGRKPRACPVPPLPHGMRWSPKATFVPTRSCSRKGREGCPCLPSSLRS
jgi:hypothetical protein